MFNSSTHSLSSAKSVRLKSSSQTFQDTVSQQQPSFYHFKLAGRSRLETTLQKLESNADLHLGRDRNQDGELSSSEIIARSTRSGTSRERIAKTLNRGSYYLQVFPGAEGSRTQYALNLSTRPVRSAKAQAGVFRARYYNNSNLAGTPVLVERLGSQQDLKELAFFRNWNVGAPTNAPADFFSAEFTTRRKLESGLYQVDVKTDDGVRVLVDDRIVLDQWANSTNGTYSASFSATGKPQRITVEYAEKGGNAAIDLRLARMEPIREAVRKARQWEATVFNWTDNARQQPSVDFFANGLKNAGAIGQINLGSNTRNDGKKGIVLDWGWGAVRSDQRRFPADQFAIRATTRAEFDGGAYRFRVKGDDGFLILAKNRSSKAEFSITPAQQWSQAYGTAKEFSYILPAGRYDVTFLYYERGEVANFDLSWAKDTNQPVVQPIPQPSPTPTPTPTSTPRPTNPYPRPTNPYPQPTNPYPQPTNPYPYPQPTNPYPQPTNPYPPSGVGSSLSWDKPLYGYPVTSRFGPRQGGGQVSSIHKGIDIGTGNETPPVEAAAKGTVVYSQTGWNGGFGNLVEIDHGSGIMTRYAHLSKISVRQGDRVDTNTIIGNVGSTGNSTGNHLHFEVVVNGEQKNPEEFINFA